MDLTRLSIFAAVADASSFTVAADKLGLPRSTVSRAIAALEEDVGTTLLHRTTRSVKLSPAGRVLLERTAPGLASLQEALSSPLSVDEPVGTLKITSTADFAAAVLADVIASFLVRWPQIKVELELTNRLVDLRGEGFDCGFRFSFGRTLKGAAIVARKLGDLDVRFYASPAYVARNGAPRQLKDLAEHSLISMKSRERWRMSKDGVAEVVDVGPRILIDEMGAGRALVRAGAGIAALPSFMARHDVTEGTLVPIMPGWSHPLATAWLVFPGKVLAKKTQLFRDHVVAALDGVV